MSRFAVDPRWLVYLPPTMAPVATSAQPGLLEHPAEAFGYFAAAGVAEVVCEEKHMGSRAVVLVTRDAAGRRRPAVRRGRRSSRGRVTRTGRPFFGPAQYRGAAGAGALRGSTRPGCGTSWLRTGCCWTASCCRGRRRRWACCATSTRRSARPRGPRCPRRPRLLEPGAGARARRGRLLAGPQRGRPTRRRSRAAYGGTAGRPPGWTGCGWPRSRCWPPSGTRHAGSRLAPGPGRPAGRRGARADPAHPALRWTAPTRLGGGGMAWWAELTGAGGEGMVVKPLDKLVRARRARPARGEVPRAGVPADHLRPGLRAAAEPGPAAGPRLGRKQSLALREYALGSRRWSGSVGGEPL